MNEKKVKFDLYQCGVRILIKEGVDFVYEISEEQDPSKVEDLLLGIPSIINWYSKTNPVIKCTLLFRKKGDDDQTVYSDYSILTIKEAHDTCIQKIQENIDFSLESFEKLKQISNVFESYKKKINKSMNEDEIKADDFDIEKVCQLFQYQSFSFPLLRFENMPERDIPLNPFSKNDHYKLFFENQRNFDKYIAKKTIENEQ